MENKDNIIKLSGVVLRVGLKYYTVRPDTAPNEPKRTAWLLKNEVSEKLELGDRFSFSVKIHYKLHENATKYEISFYEPVIVKSDADKEYYWLIQNYDNGNGFVNEKRLQKLRDLGEFDKIKKFGELRAKHKDTEIANEKKRWFGYVKDHYFKDGYLYQKGIDKLKALGAKEELEEISGWEESSKK